ncbi:MAG: 50S ribosomal protein L24 [Fibrobacteria bacterium]|nr:50S ribosomal protein L24 [Fibrobacteria bacterium]
MALKVKKGDRVVVLAGKDKGKEGIILEARPSVGKVVVEGVNQVKKHVKPSAQDAKGGIKTIEAAIDASNVMLLGKDGAPVRTTRRPDASGKRIRVAKATGEAV